MGSLDNCVRLSNRFCFKMLELPNGFKVETCTGNDPACTKTSAKLTFGGKTFAITARNCQESLKAFAGKCLDNQKIPGPNGQEMETSLCACDSDKCNSAPFSTQMSLFGLLLTT